MDNYNGAIVLVALLPLLPLAMHLRRSGKAGARGLRTAIGGSLVLLACGIAAAPSY